MSIFVRIIDQGTSTPLDFPLDVSGNPISLIARKIAEFGLKVDEPIGGTVPEGFFNFVKLNGSVGVENADTEPMTIRLTVTRRNTFTHPIASPIIDGVINVPIFALEENVPGQVPDVMGRQTISFEFTEGGIEGLIPAAYYEYTLWIQSELPFIIPVVPPTENGPIAFSGVSSVREIFFF